jgi:uncharacterized protein
MMSQLPTKIALAGLGLGGLALLWGAGIEPRLLDEQQVDAPVPQLPPTWEGKLIAVLADFQVGVWWANTDTVRRAVSRVLEVRPAATLLLGDFLYHPAPDRRKALETVRELLGPLTAEGIPTYAVLGNHDYGLDDGGTVAPARLASDVRDARRELGIVVLETRAVELRDQKTNGTEGAQPLYLVGISSHDGSDRQPMAAFDEVPDARPRLVVMHNPHSFKMLAAESAPFAVAGHTHGAQVRIPFLPGRSWLARREGEPAHISGWAADGFGQPGNHLYVNRGIGFSAAPIRFGSRPELTLFRLRGG